MNRTRPTLVRLLAFALLASGVLAGAALASEKPRAFERVGRAGSPGTTRSTTPAHVTGISHAVVNAAWTGLPAGTAVSVGSSGYTIGTDAFASVQSGIDAVDPSGTVSVLPGSYTETAAGRFLYDASGPYQFGLFFGATQGAITLQGVDASGNAITSSSAVAATINTDATNDFGPSGVFVEGDGVTIAGVRIGTNASGQNKTIEVTGDAFTLRDCDLADIWGSVYFGDWRYDAGSSTSHIQAYRISGNRFQHGLSLDVTSGAGASGPASGRVVTGNQFYNDAGDNWPSISYTGSNTGVPWFVYTVGGATITGNTFTNLDPAGQLIRARGTYDNAQFDWSAMFSSNTFDRVACAGPAAPATLTPYSYPNGYGTFDNVRRLGSSVQGEVDHAVSGDLVRVGAGTYVEQVVISGRSITVRGAGRASTVLRCPAGTLATSFATPSNSNRPVVLATAAGDIRVADLTIDGAGRGDANYRFVGAAWRNAGGALLDADVVAVRDASFSGAQHGVAVYAYSDTSAAFTFEMGGVHLSDFQKNATVFYGPTLSVDVHDCVVTGQGPTSVTAQNGLQYSSLASGSLTATTVANIAYTGGGWTACGALVYGPTTVTLGAGNVFTNCQTGIDFMDANGSLSGSTVTGSDWAVTAYNTALSAKGAVATGAGKRPPLAQAFDGAALKAAAAGPATVNTGLVVAVTNCDLTGTDSPGGNGVFAYSEGGPITVTCTGLDLLDWDIALQTWGPVALDASRNSIRSSVTAGYDNSYGTIPQSATPNWWGSASGPSGNGPGTGDAVTGANVTFAPWLTNGVDILPGPGFMTGPDNVVGPVAPSGCMATANPVVTIPVTIARTTSDNIRGYSIRIQLSANLELATNLASISQGSYLSSVGATSFQVINRGGGLYSVDCAILGLPCGATAATGTLFNVAVKKKVPGPDGPASLSIPSIVMRDCSNGTVAATAGAAATFTIDTTPPVAITNLASSPRQTGNDADGTTRIDLAFTAPSEAAVVEVYRAPFGGYPYYDNNGGVPPGTPAYPPASPWSLTSVTAGGQSDEPATRDHWYYVAFTRDACGNVSAASNLTTGTLDYHLGDVVDPALPAAIGDNLTDLADVSRLGAHYGIVLGALDPLGYLDVGPTTDLSANGRPVTDGVVDFEDLIVFAMNYHSVSAPMAAATGTPASQDALTLELPETPQPGESFEAVVRMAGAGDVVAASIGLSWDPAVVEPVGVSSGDLLARQGRGSVVLSPGAGRVDVALLGPGSGIVGEGALARVGFRVLAAGNAGVRLASVVGRDAANRNVTFGALPVGGPPAAPARTELGSLFPNPFGRNASVQLSLAREARVRVGVYDVAGRRVRSLVDGVQPAGVRILTFDGRSDAGVRLAAGVYVIRLEAPGFVQSRRVNFVP